VRVHRLLLLALSLPACGRNQPQPPAATTLDSADFVVADVRIGATQAQVRQVLGTADSSQAISDKQRGDAPQWFYDGLAVLFSPYDSLVAGIDLMGPRIATRRGLRVGDAATRVAELYGAQAPADSASFQFEDPAQPGRAVIVLVRRGRVWRIYTGLIFD
jgi:hypothetical protein